MHANFVIFNMYAALTSSILNVIFAARICDTRVSAYGICDIMYMYFPVGFIH